MKNVANEFRQFLIKQNALALAVGVVIGGAISKVVSGIVDDVLMPLISVFSPAGEWRAWQVPVGSSAIKYGDLIGRLVDFVIVAAVIFAITKALLREKKTEPTTRACPRCLEVIPKAATRCRACTSELVAV